MTENVNSTNLFKVLNAINVNDHVERKGDFAYLSWPFAVAQLRSTDPAATWSVCRFDGLPYLASEAGVFVEVAVTVQAVTLSQIHPVLDSRNRPIAAPTAFEINTSIQRCLVKAIALHGLGLYLYAGEDLPVQTAERTAANDEQSRPTMPVRAPVPVRPQPAVGREPVITKGQATYIHSLVVETSTNLRQLLDYFGVNDLHAIRALDYQRVVRSLEKRRA